MSVSRTVVLGVAGLMFLALATLGYQLRIIVQMQGVNEELSKVNFVAASQLLGMEAEVEEIIVQSKNYVAITDYGMKAKIDEYLRARIDSFDERLRALLTTLRSWEAPEEGALLADSWRDYQTQMDLMRKMPPGEGGLDKLPLSVAVVTERLRARTRSSRDAVLAGIEAKVQRHHAMEAYAETVSIFAGALFVLVGGAVAFVTLRSINGPLRQLTRGTRTVAGGEFTHRIPIDGPLEFAELARDFNAMSEKLGELDQMKKDFVAHVSHELKAPLAAIRQTLAVTLEQIPGPVNDSQRRLLKLSLNSAERLSAMVANLLDVSRMEAGAMEFELRPQPMDGIVAQIVDEFALKAAERGIKITVTGESGICVACDRDRILQVLGNLVDNALKFSPPDSNIAIEVRRGSVGIGPVLVSVTDHGPGVPEMHKKKIFLKFHQVKGSGKRAAGQGVGLGLAICKTIVDAHGGRIWVEDNSGGGSVFRFELRPTLTEETARCG